MSEYTKAVVTSCSCNKTSQLPIVTCNYSFKFNAYYAEAICSGCGTSIREYSKKSEFSARKKLRDSWNSFISR